MRLLYMYMETTHKHRHRHTQSYDTDTNTNRHLSLTHTHTRTPTYTPIERVLHRNCSVGAVGRRDNVRPPGAVERIQIYVVVVLERAQVSYHKFSKVSVLVYLQYKSTMELTFEN